MVNRIYYETTDARYNKIELVPTNFRALLICQSYNNRSTSQSKVLLHLLYLGCLCLKDLNLLKMKVIRGIDPPPPLYHHRPLLKTHFNFSRWLQYKRDGVFCLDSKVVTFNLLSVYNSQIHNVVGNYRLSVSVPLI